MDVLKAPSLQSLLESDRGSTDSLLAESLLDVEELDDVEFSIPPAGALPTLESVLSEFEADSDIASELGIPVPTPTPSIAEDSGGVRGSGAGGGGSIMRYATMQGVTAQVSSAADRINAGLATACAVAAMIAVGTSHGHILSFDVTQTLRWAHQDKQGQGAVSSLAFNPDSTRLLGGFARGLIIMIDTHTGDPLRQLYGGIITPNSGVLHVKWTSRPALGLCADSGGSVWSLSFTRKLGIRGCSSRCLFSGARGEVCAVEPLIIDTNNRHDLDQYCIVALATLSKYFIVTIRPRLKVIKYHVLQGPADCLPLLAWQMVLIQAADTTRSVDPVVVVGRGNQLFFHQLFMSHGRITLLYLRHVQLQANLLSAHWLGPKCVGCLDTTEILHLIDVRSSKELECIDVANAGLVYGSAQFKGLATGGNVSPAMALAGTHACYNSIAARGTQLYVLGARSMHMIGVRTWTERIGYLVKNQRWQEACDLALEGYRAAIDRPKRRHQARERIIMLFKEYLAASTRAPDYCLGAIIKCLIAIGEWDMLWTELWERLPHKNLFLQHITEHIENEHIQRVNPIISQALVNYWLEISPSRLEEVILRLHWTCLDLNQVLKAAKRYQLYRAQIYLNTHALGDYIISLTELIPLISAERTELGNYLLVYISSCLAGRSYPKGDIPSDVVQDVKAGVLRCLTSPHSICGAADELPYPYLRALLQFDTRETLNVISLAFQEKEFSGELGMLQRKRIIDILLEIMTPDKSTWAEIGCLLNFIAQQISMQCLPRDSELLERVLEHLAKEEIHNESARQHSERESAWHELLVNNCLEGITDDEQQLALARRAHCNYVEEYLLEKLQRYDNILDCYMNNSLRHETMFGYIERHARNPDRRIYPQLRQHFKQLLHINAAEITRLVDRYFKDQIEELLDTVSDNEELLFTFLRQLHQHDTLLSIDQCEEYLELLCKHTPDDVELFLRTTTYTYRNSKALEIVQRYGLDRAAIFLYEKQKNFDEAFALAMSLILSTTRTTTTTTAENSSNTSDIEAQVRFVSELCERASSSDAVTMKERERYWFELLQFILVREELKSITKAMLRSASQHVDLANLVQLVMNTRNVTGSFGDIKELLMSMLNNSRYETQALESGIKVLGQDLHVKFAEHLRDARRGLLVSMMRCVACQNRLYNQTDVLILGMCGHALHQKCAIEQCSKIIALTPSTNPFEQQHDNENANGNDNGNGDNDENIYQCPRCYAETSMDHIKRPQALAKSKHMPLAALAGTQPALGVLQLKAPPRKF